MAYVFKRSGAEPIVFEAGTKIAPGASGNPVGLYNPRFTAAYDAEAQFYSAAFENALNIFKILPDVDWNKCGALHLINDEKKEKRFTQMVKSWPAPSLQIVDAVQASEIAGVELSYNALYLKDSGAVNPEKLCGAYVKDIEVCLGHDFKLEQSVYDAVVLACGINVLKFYPHLPLQSVRGQISIVKAHTLSQKLKTNICYGGYISAPCKGQHIVGSTFQRWLDHTQLLSEDDDNNLDKLAVHIPSLKGLEITGARAALRTTVADHFPVVGWVDENLYVSTGHGSHGILSALMAAEILAAMILKQKSPVSEDVLKRLSPDRF